MARRAGVSAVVLGALFIGGCESRERQELLPDLAEDAPTGAILIDLEDDLEESARGDVARELAAAISPFAWPVDRSALGRELSAEAELFRIEAPRSEYDDVIDALSRDPRVEAVEVERTWSVPGGEEAPVAFRTITDDPHASDGGEGFRPNDPYYKYQWHLEAIGMPNAWREQRGAGVVVAVIDTGVAFRNEGEARQAPDLAATRFVAGWDFVDDDDDPADEHGHGTHVAGTIAQSTDNRVGVAGVAPEASIMPLRVLDRNGAGGWGGIAASIRWAADHGAQVINMSLGGGMASRAVQNAIDYAHHKGVVIVAAAGNANRSSVEYPARHRHVIAVSAVRFDRTRSFYSSYGAELDIAAPGGDLRVDQNGDGMPDGVLQNTFAGRDLSRFDYLTYQGTSMATPHVAGVAALVIAEGVRDPDEVERIVESTAQSLGDVRQFGAGLLRADAAVRAASSERPVGSGILAILMSSLVFLSVRRSQRSVAVTSTLVAFLLAGGLASLRTWGLAVPGFERGWISALSLDHGALALIALSSFLPLAIVLLTLHLRRVQPLLIGLCLGTASLLAVEALDPSAALLWVPSWARGAWLFVHAFALFWLGRQVVRQR